MKVRSLAAVLTLLAMGWLNVDKVEARYFGGYRGFYGGYRGFYGGFRGFYGRGFYGGFYRPWFRPWYGGYYAGFYRPWLYPNYYGGGYWPGYYSQPYYGGYFNNCYLSDLSYGGYALVSPPDLSPDGTFAYNGGPEKLSPLPDISPAPAKTQ